MVLPATGRFNYFNTQGGRDTRIQPGTSGLENLNLIAGAGGSTPTGGTGATFSGGSTAASAASLAGDTTRKQLGKTATFAGNAANALGISLQPGITAAFEANLESVLPGYKDIVEQYAGTVRSQLAGELPQDVVDLIEISAAEQGVQGGFGGSDIGRRAVARDLGLTSYQVTKDGQEAARALFDVTAARLTAPTVDTQRITESLIAYAAPGSVLRASDVLAAHADSARVNETAREFNESLAWDKSLSEMNQAYTNLRNRTEAELFREGLAESRRSAAAEEAAAQAILDRFVTPGQTTDTATGRNVPVETPYGTTNYTVYD